MKNVTKYTDLIRIWCKTKELPQFVVRFLRLTNFSNEKPDLPRSTNQRGSIVIRLANGIAKSWWEGFRIPPPPPSPTTQTFGITQDFGLLVICALSSLFGLVDFKGKLSKNAQEIQRAQ